MGIAAGRPGPRELDAAFLPAPKLKSKHLSSAATGQNETNTIWKSLRRLAQLPAMTKITTQRTLLLELRLRL